MRSTKRTILGALAATLLLGAFASGPASAALPEFSPATAATFTGTMGSSSFHESGGTYICSSGTVSGSIVGAKEVSGVVIKFVCKGLCTTAGSEVGTWETTALKGRLGYVNKATRTVGLLLEPATGDVADCKSPGSTAKITGSIIGAVAPVNQKKSKYTLTYQATELKQLLPSFEGEEVIHKLEIQPGGFPSPRALTLETQMSLTVSHEVEVRA